MATEEISVRFGADVGGVASGLRNMKGMIADFKSQISMGDVFDKLKSGLGTLGLGVGAGAMYEGIKSAGELAHKIEVLSETYGVSTKFLQQWEYAARKSNSSTEEADTGMKHLVENIGHAREGVEDATNKFQRWGISLTDANGHALSTQDIVEEISAKMNSVEDPTLRSAMAMDLFGKKGAELVQTLKDMDSLKGKSEGKILSESELAALGDAGKTIKSMEGSVKNMAAHAAAFAVKIFSPKDYDAEAIRKNLEGVGKPSDNAQTEDQIRKAKEMASALEELRKLKETATVTDPYLIALIRQKDAQNAFNAAKDGTLEKVKAEIDLVKANNELLKEKHNLEKKATEEKQRANEKQKEEDDRRKKATAEIAEKEKQLLAAKRDAQLNYQTAFGDRSRFSLQELADMGRMHYQNRQYETNAERSAIDIEGIESQSKQARLYGNSDYADQLQNQALDMRKSLGGVLRSEDADPMKGLRDAMDKSKVALEELVTKAKGEGIVVKLPTDDATTGQSTAK